MRLRLRASTVFSPLTRTMLVVLLSFAGLHEARADAPWSYSLEATKVAPGVYVVLGSTEHFNLKNGGNIVNTGFVVGETGVVVFDTGPSLRYGEALRALIAEIAPGRPIELVLNSHHHPDHVFGNQAFADAPIGALADTERMFESQGEAFLDNLYRLLGPWMSGTELVAPNSTLSPTRFELVGHEFELFALAGHSEADLALFDRTTGVLFCGDICFNARTPTTPNARIDAWQTALKRVEAIGAKVVVPGHGPIFSGSAPLRLNAAYLAWVDGFIAQQVVSGADMAEVMFSPIPANYSAFDTLREEFQRTVMHLFPLKEQRLFEQGE